MNLYVIETNEYRFHAVAENLEMATRIINSKLVSIFPLQTILKAKLVEEDVAIQQFSGVEHVHIYPNMDRIDTTITCTPYNGIKFHTPEEY